MKQLIETYDMVDIRGMEHPEHSRFTYRRRSPLVQSRLDYFLTTSCVQDLVHKSDIVPSILSDHSAILMHLKQNAVYARGNGYWKYNVALNKDEEYVKKMKQKLVEWKAKYNEIIDKRVVWELIKFEIRQFAQSFSKDKNKTKRERFDQLTAELAKLEIVLAESPSTENFDLLTRIKEELKQIDEERIDGLMLRAKVRWREEGEKCSKYFFGLEKQNYTKKNMTKLKINNAVITEPKAIQEEQVKFYGNLYSSKLKTKEDITDAFFKSENINQLSELDYNRCNIPISKEELHDIHK